VKRVARPITAKYLQNAAAFYLERYPSSAEGLRRVLNRRVAKAKMLDAPIMDNVQQAIEVVVAKFVDAGVIDDKAFAQTKARSLHRRGTSNRVTRQKLKMAGVDGASSARPRLWRDGGASAPIVWPRIARTIASKTLPPWPAPASPMTLPKR